MTVDYFIRPPSSRHKPRRGAGIAVLTAYCTLLLLMSTTYLRLICTIIINPGYVPRGPQWYDQHEKRNKDKSLDKNREKPSVIEGENAANNGNLRGFAYGNGPPTSTFEMTRPTAADDESSDLHGIYGRDVFICEGNGKPIWCSYCSNWKPDRAHHCREVGRCVRRMDHFCPWSVCFPYTRSAKVFWLHEFWESSSSSFLSKRMPDNAL